MLFLLQNFQAAANKANMVRFGLFPSTMSLAWIDGVAASGVALRVVDDLSSLCNGVRTSFTLSQPPASQDFAAVFWNGQQMKAGLSFVVTGITLTTLFTPQTGDVLTVWIYS